MAFLATLFAAQSCAYLEEFDEFMDQPKLNCDIIQEQYAEPVMPCAKASSYRGQCVPAADFRHWGCLELDSNANLCEDGIPFNMTVYLNTNNVSLDCKNQTLTPTKMSGMRAPYDRSVGDIDISNCEIRKPKKYGVELKRFFRGTELKRPRNDEAEKLAVYMKGHARIRFHHVDVINPGQTGIFVGQNSEEFLYENGTIDGGYTGIYLEAGNRRAVISHAEIKNSKEREGISVDSSMDNLIEYSNFSNNGLENHDINFYKNCGETHGQVCPIERELGSSKNTVIHNTFEGKINVAWRQLQPKALSRCKDIPFAGNWRDEAKDNYFGENTFAGKSSLIIRGGPIVVEANTFEKGDIEFGATATLGDTPIFIEGNITSNKFGSKKPFNFVDSRDQLRGIAFKNNMDLSGVCLKNHPNYCSQ